MMTGKLRGEQVCAREYGARWLVTLWALGQGGFRSTAQKIAQAFLALCFCTLPASVWAQVCAAPGTDTTPTASGVVNTYYEGSGNLAAGATSLTLGTKRVLEQASPDVKPGDLLLVMQMQDAEYLDSDMNRYGDDSGSGSGSTSVGNTGLYEFVTVTSVAGSKIDFAPALSNAYSTRRGALTGTQPVKKTYQVIRVPQYKTVTANGITAPAWDGGTGGVVVMDVQNTLTLGQATVEGVSNTAIFAAGKGFRGAAGIRMTSGGKPTDWVTAATASGNAGKGEGIAGTPRYVATKAKWGEKAVNPATSASELSLVEAKWGSQIEDLLGGSRARGAPGNAGGGGSDGKGAGSNNSNSGGGGGGNYAPGGLGGRPWDAPLVDASGRGGAGYASTLAFNRLFMGGGGGAGGSNDNTNDTATYQNGGISCGLTALCSSGAAGGGVVIIRAKTVTGSGMIDARGAHGYNVQQDAAGGGGAGGSVVIYSTQGGAANVDVRGGDGGNAWAGRAGSSVGERHGPGGGGGGGFVAFAPESFQIKATLTGGTPGRTTNGASDNYNATGNNGGLATFKVPNVPGVWPGAQCSPDLVLEKTDYVTTLVSGSTTVYSLTVSNRGASASTGLVTVVDVLPAGLSVPSGAVALDGAQAGNWSCNAAGQVLTCTSNVSIAGNGGTSTFAFAANVNSPDKTAVINKARVGGGGDPNKNPPDAGSVNQCSANDPLTGCAIDVDTVFAPLLALTKTDNTDTVVAGGTTTYTLSVANAGAEATSAPIVVADVLPAGMSYVGASPFTSGNFACTYAAGTNSFSCTQTAVLASGGVSSFSIPVKIASNAPSSLTNKAQVGAGGDPSKPTAPNATTVGNCSSAPGPDFATGCAADTDVLTSAKLLLSKTDGKVYMNKNGTTTYDFTVTNSGDAASFGTISFRDVLPSPMTWPTPLTVSNNTGNWSCTRTNDTTVDCSSNAVIPMGGSSKFSLLANVGNVAVNSQYMNRAQIVGGGAVNLSTTGLAPASCTNDNLPNEGCAVDLNTAQDAAQIRLAKTHADPQAKKPGDSITFTLAVSNNGGVDAAAGTVKVMDWVVGKFTDVKVASPQDVFTCSVDSLQSVVECTNSAGALKAKTTVNIVFTAKLATADKLTVPLINQAQVGTNGSDPQNPKFPDLSTVPWCSAKDVPYVGCAVDPIPLSADLKITKAQKPSASGSFSNSPLTVATGSRVQFQLVVSNVGGFAADGALLEDAIPANFSSPSIVSASASGTGAACSAVDFAFSGNKLSGKVAQLPVGTSCTVVVEVTASTNGAAVINTATVDVPTGLVDADKSNNSASVETTIAPLTITATKSVSANPLVVSDKGQNYKIAITVTNGPTTAPITIADPLPTGITLAGAPSVDGGAALQNCGATSGSAIGPNCSLAAGLASGTYTLTIPIDVANAAVAAGGTNKANLGGGGDALCTALNNAEGCDPSTPTVTVKDPIAIKLTKTVGADPLVVGVASNYTLKVELTNGSTNSADVVVTDTIPQGLTLGTMPEGCTNAGQVVTCTVAANALSKTAATKSFVIPVTPTDKAGASVTNTAKASGGGDASCTGAGDCTSSVTTPVKKAPEIVLTKTGAEKAVIGAKDYTYTLTVKNTGETDTAGDVIVKDQLPEGVIVTAISKTDGVADAECGALPSKAGALLTCTVPGPVKANGESKTFTLTVTLPADAGVIVNYASTNSSGKGTPDADPGEDCNKTTGASCASATTEVNTPAELAIAKSAGGVSALGADKYSATYVVTVRNIGGSAGNYTLTDTLGFPANATLEAWTVASTDGVVNAPLPAVQNGAAVQISKTDTPIAAKATHTYLVTVFFTSTTSVTDLVCTGAAGHGAYNQASVGSSPASDCADLLGAPKLALTKTSNGPWIVAQDDATYTLTVSNTGNAATAGEITISDVMPQGITPVSGTFGEWVCQASGQSVTCKSQAVIAAGGSSSVKLPVAVDASAAASVVNKASVGGGGDPSNGGEPPNPETCTGDAHCANTTTPITPKVELAITKVASPASTYTPGSSLNYTIVVTNNGPSDASHVSVTDNVPAEVTVSKWSCTQLAADDCGTGTGNRIALDIASLKKGEHVTITVMGTARLDATGDIKNIATANVTGVNCGDKPCNPSAEVTNKNDGTPKLNIAKAAKPGVFTVGAKGFYAITVSNVGTTSTNGEITVTDTLPAGVTMVLADLSVDPAWNCSASTATTLNCTTSKVLLPGVAAPIIEVPVMVAASAAPTTRNTAQVGGGGDTSCTSAAPCPSNEVNTPVNSPKLDVKKTLQNGFVVGVETNYIITVTNNGNADTLAGFVSDNVPAGLVIGKLDGTGCTVSGQVVSCAIDAGLQSGKSLVFTIPVTPQASVDNAQVINKAVVDASTGDGSCPAREGCTGTSEEPVNSPQLTLTKELLGDKTFTVGKPGIYRLVVTNTGPVATVAGQDVVVADVMPSGLIVDASSLPAACTIDASNAQRVVCTISSLASKESKTFDIQVTPQAALNGLQVINQATAHGGGDYVCTDSAAVADLPARCKPSVTTSVEAPKLVIEKTAVPAAFSVGVPASYVLKVTNDGAKPTSGKITVIDTMPASLAIDAAALTAECSVVDLQVTCESTAVLQVGESLAFTIPVTPLASAAPQVSNSAVAAGGGDPSCDKDCSTTIITNVDSPALQLVKKASATSWVVGQSDATYSLVVTNVSPTASTDGVITARDSMPAGIGADWSGELSADNGNWSCSVAQQEVVCVSKSGFSLGANVSSTIVLPVTVGAAAVPGVTNHASVGGGGDPFNNGEPPVPGANCTDATHCASLPTPTNLPAAITVSKSDPVIAPTSTPGQFTASYLLKVKNTGGVIGAYTLADQPGYPQAVTLDGWAVSVLQGSGAINPALPAAPVNGGATQISADAQAIASGDEHIYQVVVRFTSNADVPMEQLRCSSASGAGYGAFNTALLGGQGTSQDAGCADIPGLPRLHLVKTSNRSAWAPGQSGAAYFLAVSNTGNAPTVGQITVRDALPAGVSLVSFSDPNKDWTCSANGQEVTCTSKAVIQPAATSFITLTVSVASNTPVGSITNHASVGGGGDPTGSDTPPEPTQCAAGDLHCSNVTTTISDQPFPTVTKDDNTLMLTAGATTTYTVTLSNSTSTTISNITWRDEVVEGLSNVSIISQTATSSSNAGQCSGLTCSGIVLAPRGSASYQVRATASSTAGVKAINKAVVTGGGCTQAKPCIAVDTDLVIGGSTPPVDPGKPVDPSTPIEPGKPVKPNPVPVNSQWLLLGLSMLLMAGAAMRRRKQR